MIAALLLAASHVLGVSPTTGVAEYYGSDELKAEIRKPLVRRTYPIERMTEADRAAALEALAGVKTIVVWGHDTGWIWDGAFEGAPDLERIVLRSGVRTIGNRAFADCPRFTTVISECNYVYDFADDAFAGVTNALTLIECASDHKVAEPWGPFARVIKLNRMGKDFERFDRNSRELSFGGPFVSGNWVYTLGDPFHDGEAFFNKAILELALKPEEVKSFPNEIDGHPVSRRNYEVVPEADAARIRAAERAFELGESDGDATYRIVDGEARVFEYSREKIWTAEEIVLPETLGGCPVTELPAGCFSGYGKLRRLVLPTGLKAIPEGFCAGCPRLASVEVPASVKRIGRGAFYGCPALDLPKLADDVEVAEWAFGGRDVVQSDDDGRRTDEPAEPSFTVRYARSPRENGPLPPVRYASFRTGDGNLPYGRRFGFDLALNAFVKPNGRGEVADLYVTAEAEPKRLIVEAGETTRGFHRAACVRDGCPVPAFAAEEMSGEPIVITDTNAMCWIAWRGGWTGHDEPLGEMVYFTARGVPAALNWWFSPKNEGCACSFSIRVNAGIVPKPAPADCDADLVETEAGVAVYYGGWSHPPVAGREVTDSNVIRRLVVDRRVQEIPDGAFCGLGNLRQVAFAARSEPVRIGYRAFADCPSLRLIDCGWYDWEPVVETNSFEGCASDLMRLVIDDGEVQELSPAALWWTREFRIGTRFERYSHFTLEGDFLFGIDEGKAMLVRYFGDEETVRLPESVEDLPVRKIGLGAFPSDGRTRKVLLPERSVELPLNEQGGPVYVKEADAAEGGEGV